MAETITAVYDGADIVTVTISGSVVDRSYVLNVFPFGFLDSDTGDGGVVVLDGDISGGGFDPGEPLTIDISDGETEEGIVSFAAVYGTAFDSAGPLYARFFEGYATRIAVTRVDPTPSSENVVETVALLDRRATERVITRILNQPHEIRMTVASDDEIVSLAHEDGHPNVEEGVRALMWFRGDGGDPKWTIREAWLLTQIEDAADNDRATTRITGHDGWMYLNSRPFVLDDGTFGDSDEGVISFSSTKAGVIALSGLLNTIANHGSVYIDFGPDYGGTEFWAGTVDDTAEIDYQVQVGAMVGEVWTDLANAAYFDIVLTAIYDPVNRPGYLWEGSLYTQAGQDRHDVIFGWDAPPRTLAGITRLKDGLKRANVVQFFDADGNPVDPETDASSIATYGQWHGVQSWPGQPIPEALSALAQEQLRLRKNGQTTVTLQPVTERAPVVLTAYDVGDRVHVNASKRLRRPLTGLQRVYGVEIAPGADGTERVTRLLTSADGVG